MRATIWDTGKLGTKLGYGTIRAVLNRDIDCTADICNFCPALNPALVKQALSNNILPALQTC